MHNKTIENYHSDLKKKLRRTTAFYALLNIILYTLGAAIVVLNIFAIRKNPGSDSDKWLFVAVAILTSLTSFASSVISIFSYRKKNNNINSKISQIKNERAQHKNEILEYEVKDKDAVLVEKVRRIINK